MIIFFIDYFLSLLHSPVIVFVEFAFGCVIAENAVELEWMGTC